MFVNNLALAFRSLWKNRFFSLLNLISIAVGTAACLLIVQYVRFERSYDRQGPNADHIWRGFNQTVVNGAVVTEDANTHSALGPSLKNDLPGEVTDYARVFNRSEPNFVFLKNQEPVRIESTWLADPGFLRLFPQKALAGVLESSLDEPFSLVLSRAAAERLYGTVEAAIGQTVRIPAEPFYGLFTVKAVVENPPANTHIKFNALASYATRYTHGHQDNWQTYWEYNYFQLAPQADPARVQAKLAEYSHNFLEKEGIRLGMQRLTDIHLHSNLTYEIEPNGSARSVRFLGIVAALVLLIAFVNYINLSTARALKRAREVGVRKAIGASRGQLVGQFLLEGAVLNLIALVGALGIVVAVMPVFSALVDRPLAVLPGYDGTFWMLAAGLWATSVVAASFWPALSLSGFSALRTLKGNFVQTKREKMGARHGLVVFQFACSMVLLVAVFTIRSQLSFLKKHDKGLSLDQIVTLQMPKNDWRLDSINAPKMSYLKQELARISGVKSVAVSYMVPGIGVTTLEGTSNRLTWVGNPAASGQGTTYFLDVEKTFFETYGIRLLAGGVFDSPNDEASAQNVLINQTALKMLGFPSAEAAIGQSVVFERSPEYLIRIHGVVADFHIESLKEPTRPTIYYCRKWLRSGYVSLKLATENTADVLAQVQPLWQRVWPETPLEMKFLDDQFNAQYRTEQQLGHVFGLFAGLAVLIACIGLFGLATFTAEQRTKEIGIRKVLGASVAGITSLLAKDFLKLVVIAIFIASPLAYYCMQRWLADFAYRVDMQWWMFAVAGAAAAAIAFLTVGFQSVRAALANPVKSLRSE